MGAALVPIGTKMHTWSTAACAAAAPGQAAVLAAAKYLAATAVDLLTQPERLKVIKAEFAERTKGLEWKTVLPEGYEPPMYEPPARFLKKSRTEVAAEQHHLAAEAGRVAREVLLAGTGADTAEVEGGRRGVRAACPGTG